MSIILAWEVGQRGTGKISGAKFEERREVALIQQEGATGSDFLTQLRSDYMVIFKDYTSYQAPPRRL